MPKPLLVAFALLLAATSLAASARQQPAALAAPAAAATSLVPLQQQLKELQQAADDKASADTLARLRGKALDIQDQATALAAGLEPQQQSLQSQLAVLGPLPTSSAPAEAPEVKLQRRRLERSKADVDAQIKQAQLLAQSALQAATQLSDQRRNDFQARLASRTASPMGRTFWSDAARTLPGDMTRLSSLADETRSALARAWQPPRRTPLLACLIAAALLLGVVRVLAEWIVVRLTSRRMPPGHLRRSTLAAAVVAMTVLITGLAAQLCFLGIRWNNPLPVELALLGQQIVRLVVLSAFVAGLGRALLSARRPSWRLPNLSNREAQSLQPFPWLLGLAVLALGLLERLNSVIGASLPVSVLVRGAIALLLASLLGIALLRLAQARRGAPVASAEAIRRPPWLGLLLTAARAAVIASWIAVAFGYIALGFYLATITLWIGVVVCSMYLLMHLISDGFTLLLSPQGRNGQRLQQAFDLKLETLEQACTILTGLTRTLFVLLAVASVFAKITASPSDLFSSLTAAWGVFRLGHVSLSLGDIVDCVLVIVIGLTLLRTFKRWLVEKLLPQSSLEPGMQNSLVTLLGYVGFILVFVLALASLQVSLQNITWIASALSVGIGFGLQAIVQNFISGLILLAERPVKVGDWVSLNGVEGDIRRINVRATEIQLWDRSTVIVPNSQFITENVRNVTLANALGRVYFLLPLPLDTDAAKAQQILANAVQQHPAILREPAAVVRLDSLDASTMHFSVIGYVRSPRDVASVRSELLFTILEQLRQAQVQLIRPQDMRMHSVSRPDGPGHATPVAGAADHSAIGSS